MKGPGDCMTLNDFVASVGDYYITTVSYDYFMFSCVNVCKQLDCFLLHRDLEKTHINIYFNVYTTCMEID